MATYRQIADDVKSRTGRTVKTCLAQIELLAMNDLEPVAMPYSTRMPLS